MSKADILTELPKLSPEDRAEVRAKLDELDGWLDGGELTQEERRMLDGRLEAYKQNPDQGSSWEEVEARIKAKLRQ